MSKRKELRGPDAYQKQAVSVAGWLADNRTPVLIGVLVLLLGGLGAAALAYNMDRKADLLSYEMSKAVKLYEAAKEVPTDAPEERAKSLDEARKAMLALYDETVDTSAHSFVMSYLANIYIDRAEYPEAVGVLLQLEKELADEPDRLALALFQLAKVYAAQYQPDEAMKVLQRALTIEPNPIRDVIRDEISRLNLGSLNRELTQKLQKQFVEAQQQGDKGAAAKSSNAK